MEIEKRVFSFDIGWAFHGWAVKGKDGEVKGAGVYAFEHENFAEDYAKISREKRRRASRRKRLSVLGGMVVSSGLFPTKKEFERFIKKHSGKNQIWKSIEESHRQPIDEREFAAILYRFAKRRYYVDMRKKTSFEKTKNGKKQKEEGVIKKALSSMDEVRQSAGGDVTWFEVLFQRRANLMKTLRDMGIAFDEERFPYTNRKWSKFLNKDVYKKAVDKKAASGYELLLKNEWVAESLKEIARRQREMGKTHPVFSEEFMDRYAKLITFKGTRPSFEDKIGLCLSGEDLKRHPVSSVDAEKAGIAQSLHSVLHEIDDGGNLVHEFKIVETGIDFETYGELLLSLANNKGEVTAGEIVKALQEKKYLSEGGRFFFKQFKRKKKPERAVVMRLPGHLRMRSLSNSLWKILLENDELRDRVEFAMLSYRDPDTLKERLGGIFEEAGVEVDGGDLEMLALSDPGKPAPCHNRTYRKILPSLVDGKDFQSALSESFPNALTKQKRYYRKYLDYGIYKADRRRKGINNPYQDKIIKEFVFLFNRLVQKFGEPDEIVFETTREILSAKEKKEIEKKINDNTELNQKIELVLDAFSKENKKKPSKGARERLKLFVQQGGELLPDKNGNRADAKCVLSGNPISLEAAIEGDRTNVDHIIPQSWIHDNRLDNKILLDAGVNQGAKADMTPMQYLTSLGYSQEKAKKLLKKNIKGMELSETKERHLYETRGKEILKKDAEDRIHNMDQRMAGEQGHAVKDIMSLLVDQLRFNTEEKLTLQEYRSRILPVGGGLTGLFRRGWLPEYKKDRSQYHNHAIDALVMLNFDRSMLQRYVKLLKKSYLEDRNPIWMTKSEILPKIDDFEALAMEIKREFEEQRRVVVRREQRKYRGRVYKEGAYRKGDKNSALPVRGYFRDPANGFSKLLVFRDEKGKRKTIRVHPSNPGAEEAIHEGRGPLMELYRYSLVRVKHKNRKECGYFFITGYEADGRIRLIPANFSQEEDIRLNPSGFSEFEYIREVSISGVVKDPGC